MTNENKMHKFIAAAEFFILHSSIKIIKRILTQKK